MPIPKKYRGLRRLRALLTWADLDEATGEKTLANYKRIFRWLFDIYDTMKPGK